MPITISGSTGIAGVDGSASTPAVQGTDTNTGIAFPAADTVAIGTGGTERMRVDSSGNVGIGTSSPGTKLQVNGNLTLGDSIITGTGTSTGDTTIEIGGNRTGSGNSFIDFHSTASTDFESRLIRVAGANGNFELSNTGTGAFYLTQGGAGPILFLTSSAERARITAGGNLLVGTTSDNGSRLRVTGNAYFDNLIYSPGVYNQTTGSAANLHIATDGNFFRSTSSRKYKRDIQDATFGLSNVLALRPVTYKGKSEADGETVFGGLIAEEVHDAGLTQFVQYAEDGTPDALAYGNMVALCIKAIQELKAENDDLKARLTALEAK